MVRNGSIKTVVFDWSLVVSLVVVSLVVVLTISVFRSVDCIRKKPGELSESLVCPGSVSARVTSVVGGTRVYGYGAWCGPVWYPVVLVRATCPHCFSTVSPLGPYHGLTGSLPWPHWVPTMASFGLIWPHFRVILPHFRVILPHFRVIFALFVDFRTFS